MAENAQLDALAWVCRAFEEHGVEYWLFGGWAVDFHVGRATRPHDDLDLAGWAEDRDGIAKLLEGDGWSHTTEEGEDGYTGYERNGVRLELAHADPRVAAKDQADLETLGAHRRA